MKNNMEDVRMTYTCLLSQGGEKIVRVTFERSGAYAEGIVPEGKIEKQEGFSEEEASQLALYLKLNKDAIWKKAKEITGFTHWF